MNTQTRIFHVTGNTDHEIIAEAVALKSTLVNETMQDSRATSSAFHSTLAAENFKTIWIGGSLDGVIRPGKSNRTARNRKRQAVRGFCFSIEGRPGVYKLTANNEGFERVNGAWNGHSPNFYERTSTRVDS